MNRWDQHLGAVFPISDEDLRMHNGGGPSSADFSSLLPTGWHMLATDQTHWKQLRDETVTRMIDNLQLKLHNSNNDVKLSLARLQSAGHMRNVTLPDVVVDDIALPVDGESTDSSSDEDEQAMGTSASDLFATGPQIAREYVASVSLPVLPTVESVLVNTLSGGAASSSGLPIGPGRLGNRSSTVQAWFNRTFQPHGLRHCA